MSRVATCLRKYFHTPSNVLSKVIRKKSILNPFLLEFVPIHIFICKYCIMRWCNEDKIKALMYIFVLSLFERHRRKDFEIT